MCMSLEFHKTTGLYLVSHVLCLYLVSLCYVQWLCVWTLSGEVDFISDF